LISTYIATTVARVITGGVGFFGGITIPTNLLLLSGISAITFATAKQITKNSKNFLDFFGVENLAELKDALSAKDPQVLQKTKDIVGFKDIPPDPSTAIIASTNVQASPTSVKPRFFRDLFYKEGSNFLDLGDFQMSIITFLAILVYVGQILGYLGMIILHKNVALPDVDSTLLATFGIGQGTYIAKKYVDETLPK
jgi:hypothetical protein